MANIAEGFERNGKKEFIQFFSVSKGSSGEVRSHLYIALDLGWLNEKQFLFLYNMNIEISKMISGLMKYLRKSILKVSKFKE